MTEHFDAEAALQRIREARGTATPQPSEPENPEDDPRAITDVADLGARMFGHRYPGDPIAKITDRMFRR